MRRVISKVSGIFIPVTDMRRSADWYISVFDLEVIDDGECCTGLAFPNEATILNLWKVDRAQPTHFEASDGMRIPYYNFESFDIGASHAALQAKGIEVTAIQEDAEGVRYFDCIDPDGNALGFIEELPHSPYYPHKQKYRRD
ncbi:putative enzyme related to lactoylglutathione lyase [Paenibacillus cellulosilyticus]|uniref:Putative enzyme related to lactoylglutathione lyase n=1 Tax=Paenibacillus cellulosilyticus TaxID=375489 RepID=A0A2V2YVE9_9BACL|nr:VOC family protein [Paenibacillus cellulosilyticus]PWW05118.1 putative enzyme related to lactoylglutathione lyase [Paenibacillus cellulosilyticus]QKS48667.1 VOC family protein [Paenibacillus cellulosilyticus]